MARDKKLIIGNWKMNLGVHESSLYLNKLEKKVKIHRNVEVVLAPSLLALQTLSLQVDRRQFRLAAQNFYWRDYGAYTGEISASQLRGIATYGIVGHSERRYVFHETDRDTRAKVQSAVRNDITPVLCIGETAGERASDETNDVLRDQLLSGLANITGEDVENTVIAYEPVWAIGTGDNAMPRDVMIAVRTIRSELKHLFGAKVADNVRVLYGGSVSDLSAADYLAIPGVDGLLVGGASLNADVFSEIVEKAYLSGKKDN